MALKAQVREAFKKYVGFMEVELLPFVNPDLEQLKEMGFDFDKEPEYAKEVEDKDSDGNVVWTGKQLELKFYFKNKEGEIFNTKFYLKDRVKKSKDKPLTQFVNAEGNSSYAESEAGLLEWFTKAGGVKEGKDGEGELLEFLKFALNKADYRNGFELTIDNWKKLMDGNVKEIEDIVKNENIGSLLIPLVVRTTSEGEEYQQVFNRSIVPGYLSKNLRLITNQGKESVKEEDIEKWTELNKTKEGRRKLNPLNKAILKLDDREHGCKDDYYLGFAKVYVAGEDEGKDEERDSDGPGY